VEAGKRAKGLAWLAVVTLACGFFYCIGFQFGWTQATVHSDQRMEQLGDVLDDLAARSAGGLEGAGEAAQVTGDSCAAAS
jgi:hypothetical protein